MWQALGFKFDSSLAVTNKVSFEGFGVVVVLFLILSQVFSV